MAQALPGSEGLLQRMVNAVEQVRQRLLKATGALRDAGVEHCIIGGNAVAAWVATVDQAAVRNTQDVEILIQRNDLNAARRAVEGAGSQYRRAANIDLFLDTPDASPRQAVHLVCADELIKPGEPAPTPSVSEATSIDELRVINLDALVRIKLTAFRDKDRTHLRDLIDAGLIDQAWTAKLDPAPAERLQSLPDTPGG